MAWSSMVRRRLAGLREGWLAPLAQGATRARTLGLAAEMAFWMFLSLVPLAAVAGLVTARVATSHNWVGSALLASVPASSRSLVARQVDRVAAWRGGQVAPVAVVTFLWLASSGIQSVFAALELQMGIARPWWKKRVFAIATCVGLSVGVALVAVVASGVGSLTTLIGSSGAEGFAGILKVKWSFGGNLARSGFGIALAIAMVAGLYRVGIPRTSKRTNIPVWPGALLAVSLQSLLGGLYGLYVTIVGTGDAYFAGLAVVGVTLTALWLFAVALLLGAELNRVIGERKSSENSHPATLPKRPAVKEGDGSRARPLRAGP